MNPTLYKNYPGLFDKIDTLAANVFFWLPFCLWAITTIQPVNVLFHSPLTELAHTTLNIVGGDLWFYSLHRLLHHPLFYWLHKQHHEVVHPIGVLSLYAHPFDAIILNMGSMLILHLFLQTSFFQICLLGTFATVNTIVQSHTGRGQYGHHIHHLYRNCNYGIGLFMDRLFLTNRDS